MLDMARPLASFLAPPFRLLFIGAKDFPAYSKTSQKNRCRLQPETPPCLFLPFFSPVPRWSCLQHPSSPRISAAGEQCTHMNDSSRFRPIPASSTPSPIMVGCSHADQRSLAPCFPFLLFHQMLPILLSHQLSSTTIGSGRHDLSLMPKALTVT